MGVRGICHNEIYLSVSEQLRTADGSLVGDTDAHVGMFFVKPLEVGNQKIPANGITGSDAQLALQGGIFTQESFSFLNQMNRRLDMRQQHFALGSQ